MAEQTIPYDLGAAAVGYMLNTAVSVENQGKIGQLQRLIQQRFGEAVWLAPPESLHITLMDWIRPTGATTPDRNKDELFASIRSRYDTALRPILGATPPVSVLFNAVVAFPNGIILQGQDDGSYARIRQGFAAGTQLLDDTKQPNIIHCSIARFTKAIDLPPVQSFAAALPCHVTHITSEFRLVRESRDPMLEFSQVASYRLG